jgi:hypothetical protein
MDRKVVKYALFAKAPRAQRLSMDYLQGAQPCVALALKSSNSGDKATRVDSAGTP